MLTLIVVGWGGVFTDWATPWSNEAILNVWPKCSKDLICPDSIDLNCCCFNRAKHKHYKRKVTSEGGWEDDVPFPQVRYDIYGLVPCMGAHYHYHHLVFFKRKKPTLQVLPLPDNEIMYSALSAALEKGQQWERVSTLNWSHRRRMGLGNLRGLWCLVTFPYSFKNWFQAIIVIVVQNITTFLLVDVFPWLTLWKPTFQWCFRAASCTISKEVFGTIQLIEEWLLSSRTLWRANCRKHLLFSEGFSGWSSVRPADERPERPAFSGMILKIGRICIFAM